MAEPNKSLADLIRESNEERARQQAEFEKRLKALEDKNAELEKTNGELTQLLLGGNVPPAKQAPVTSNPKTLDDFIANEVAKRK